MNPDGPSADSTTFSISTFVVGSLTRFQNSSIFGCPTAASNFDNTSCKQLREVTVTRSTLIRLVERIAFFIFNNLSTHLPGRSCVVQLKSNRTLPPRWECSIASLIWDSLYVVVTGKVNLPEATTFAASVSAARILGRYSSLYIQKPWMFSLLPMRSPCGT